MMPLVPQKTTVTKPDRSFQELSDLLLSGLEFVGAAAGWIGLHEAGGGLIFPVRAGVFSDSWLPWPQDHGSVWGFTVSGEPAVLNDLRVGSKRCDPPLRNLLSCPLIHNQHILGHVALANKAHGFSAEDAVVLQGLAHHMVRLLGRRGAPQQTPIELSASWRRILDRAGEGILLFDESGVLIYANAAWLHWTGFCAEELLGRTAPFPFWVSQQELVQALCRAPIAPAGALPFRRRDLSLFWCLVETAAEHWDDRLLTIAFLRQTADLSPDASAPTLLSPNLREARVRGGDGNTGEKQPSLPLPSLDWLPLLLDLDHGVEGWEARWEEQTGLSRRDVEDSRCDLVLDWLFPQQHDRNRVADCFHHPDPTGFQLVLEVAAPNSSRPMLCTFLPLPTDRMITASRRWLLLLGEVEKLSHSKILDETSQTPANI